MPEPKKIDPMYLLDLTSRPLPSRLHVYRTAETPACHVGLNLEVSRCHPDNVARLIVSVGHGRMKLRAN